MFKKENLSFWNLFFGRISSVLADSILFFALLKWIEVQADDSQSYLFFYVAYYLPIVFFSLPVGAWIENKTLQKVMIWSDWIRIVIIVGFLLTYTMIDYRYTYILLAALSMINVFFIPANQALLPEIIDTSFRAKANSLFQIGFTVVKIVGQVSATFLIKSSVSLTVLLLISVVLLFISFLFIWHVKPWFKKQHIEQHNPITRVKEGLQYIQQHRHLHRLFLFLAVAMLFATSIDLVLLTFLTDILQIGVENLSFIGASSLIGILLGAGFLPRFYGKVERKWLIVPPLFLIGLSLSSLLLFNELWFMLPFFCIQGIALGGFNVTFVTYLQDEVEREQYTRIFSTYHMITSSMALPGVLLIGMIIHKWQTIHTIQGLIIVFIVLGILGLFFIPRLGKGQKQLSKKG